MFFFSGIVFPITNLPEWIQWVSEVFPLTHSARLIRACCLRQFSSLLFFDILFMVAFTIVFGYLAVSRLEKRLIQ
jgi:ABC-2 type transporter.